MFLEDAETSLNITGCGTNDRELMLNANNKNSKRFKFFHVGIVVWPFVSFQHFENQITKIFSVELANFQDADGTVQ